MDIKAKRKRTPTGEKEVCMYVTKEQGDVLLAALSREEEYLLNARGCFDMGTLERESMEKRIKVVQALMKKFESVALG